MTSNKHSNLSVIMKPKCSIRMKIHRLPDIEGLTENEINRPSTSVRIKRRVAHVPKYPPMVKKPLKLAIVPAVVTEATGATVATSTTVATKQAVVLPERILSSSELNAYMKRPIKERKIRTEVAVPWAYTKPASSSVGAKVKAIKENKKIELKERAFSKKKERKGGNKFIL